MDELRGLRIIFGAIEDPRADNARHKLFDIIFMSIAATLAGAKTCFQMAEFADAKKPLLSRLLGVEHVPSHDTFSRIFRLLDPIAFEAAFREFTRLFARLAGAEGVVSLDGKALRNAIEEGGRFQPLHMVNVWASGAGIALAQRKAPNRNEVAGLLDIIQLVSIEGTTVTADALHCRPDVAQAILDRKADYVLTLKANRPGLLKDAKACIERAPTPSRAKEPTVRSHGRFERREAIVVPAPGLAQARDFPGLVAVGCIRSWRGSTKLPKNPKLRFFVLSRLMTATELLEVVRAHWGIENNLHWCLDVTFGEDKARARKDHAPENLAALRKIALNMLQAHPAKMPLNHKILRAGWDDDFLRDLFLNAQNAQTT